MAVSPQRRKLLGAVHATAKARGLDEDSRRDHMEQLTGHRSAAKCSDAQLKSIISDLNGNKGRGTSRQTHAKIRALWFSLWNLGWAESPAKEVQNAFVKRQTGIDLLTWIDDSQARQVIEALKAIAERECGVDWSEIKIATDRGHNKLPKYLSDRIRVVQAQWSRLNDLGTIRIASEAALIQWAKGRNIIPNDRALHQFEVKHLDEAQRLLGRWLRGALKRTDACTETNAGFLNYAGRKREANDKFNT